MLGAVCGDIVGSRFEFAPLKSTDFDLFHGDCRFTDDTVCTLAVAKALMDGTDLSDTLADWVLAYVDAGYGLHFLEWALMPGRAPYNSWGNGSAMRVSPAAWLADGLGDTARLAARTAAVSHDHHHGVRGAKATAVAVRMGLEGWSKEEIRNLVSDRFGYDLSRRTDDIRPRYQFEVSCQKSVPEALICALEADSWEGAVRLAVSLGGDADTQAAIAGGVAEALYGLPEEHARRCEPMLDDTMRGVVAEFLSRTAGRRWERTDPGAVERDLPPPREGDDPFSAERVVAEVDKLAALERSVRAASNSPAARLKRWFRRAFG